jgi:hypoxanthine phosphoribosyltransferase
MTSIGRCELITWDRFFDLSRQLALNIHKASFQPDIIVAISRGGCVPARVICDYLDVFDLDVIKIEHYHGTQKQSQVRLRYPMSADVTGKKVLLIDDVSDTGDSFQLGIQHLLESNRPADLKTAALHHKIVSSYTPDFYAEIVHKWRWIIYPWAVIEDLRSILQQMQVKPLTVEEFSNYIAHNHQLEVSQKILQDVLSLSDLT